MANLDGKQVVIIVGQKNYNDEEFTHLFEALENEGADVCVVVNFPPFFAIDFTVFASIRVRAIVSASGLLPVTGASFPS